LTEREKLDSFHSHTWGPCEWRPWIFVF